MGVPFIFLLPSTRGPALPMRARQLRRRPGQLFGLSVDKRGATTLAIQRSLSGAWTMGQSVCRALTADSTATCNIQGAYRIGYESLKDTRREGSMAARLLLLLVVM